MYIEYVFLQNFIINFFIASISQRIMKNKAKTSILGVFLVTIIAVICPLFNQNVITSIIIKLSSSVIFLCLLYKKQTFKKWILSYFVLVFTTFFFGGCCEALNQFVGETTYLLTLLSSLIVYFVTNIVIKSLHRKKIIDSFCTEVTIVDGDKIINEKAYFDSGNLLYDPITSKPISLITEKVFEKLYGENIISVILKKYDKKKLKNGHYIEVNSAVKNGKMLVFDVDELIIHKDKQNKSLKDISLGLSFSGFEKAMNSQVLLHSSSTFN